MPVSGNGDGSTVDVEEGDVLVELDVEDDGIGDGFERSLFLNIINLQMSKKKRSCWDENSCSPCT